MRRIVRRSWRGRLLAVLAAGSLSFLGAGTALASPGCEAINGLTGSVDFTSSVQTAAMAFEAGDEVSVTMSNFAGVGIVEAFFSFTYHPSFVFSANGTQSGTFTADDSATPFFVTVRPPPGGTSADYAVTCISANPPVPVPVPPPAPAPVSSPEHTTQLIEDFLTTRADLVLANQPDLGRRIARLNGVASSAGNPVSALMGYLPGIVEGNPLSVSTSLAAIDSMAGNQQPSAFDVWFEGTFALFDAKGPNGSFNTASLGVDYLVSPDLLIGGFAQLDRLAQHSSLDPATISGTGWLAGPYATARLNDNLYLDLLAAAGTSSNTVSPYGTYEDGFDATRWLVSASLQGQWQWDNWTFSPRARLSYFEETSKAYTDSLGVGIPAVTAGLGQIAIGPAISYRYTTTGNVVIDTGLRFEGVADILNTASASGFDNLHGRIEGTIDLSLPGGARFGLSTAFDGIGSETRNATSAKVTVSLPMP